MFIELVETSDDISTIGLGAMFPTQITIDGTKGLFIAPTSSDAVSPALRVLRFHAIGQFQIPTEP